MHLAVSNLAWDTEREGEVLTMLSRRGIRGLEVAPWKIFGDPVSAELSAIEAYRRKAENHGLTIVALQGFLYGRPDLKLFDDDTREDFIAYMESMTGFAAAIGAPMLIYGAVNSRDTLDKDDHTCFRIAVEAFQRIGRAAHVHGVSVCIEPNPAAYGCRFLTTAVETAAFVQSVNQPGIGLHLDTGCAALAGEHIFSAIRNHVGLLRHFHASEPHLAPLKDMQIHMRAAEALRAAGYGGWVSLEMLPSAQLTASIDVLTSAYAAPHAATV